MAELAVLSVASKILSTIASPAFKKAYEKACSIKEAREELGELGVTLKTIRAVLLDAEKKEQDSAAIKNWIKRLKGVLYDAEDLFDEVATNDLLKQQRKKLPLKGQLDLKSLPPCPGVRGLIFNGGYVEMVAGRPPLSTQLDHFNPGASTSTSISSSSSSRAGIKFDSGGRPDDEYFQETDESSQFRQEFEMRKMKQDQGLDIISEGLDTLKDMAQDINEEFDRQLPLIDEIDDKIDRATSDLKTTNVRLKDTVNKMRSSRNFCIDIILLCILLGIAAYLYNALK